MRCKPGGKVLRQEQGCPPPIPQPDTGRAPRASVTEKEVSTCMLTLSPWDFLKDLVSLLVSEHIEIGNYFSPGASVTAEQGDGAAEAQCNMPTVQHSNDMGSRPLVMRKT